MVNCVITSKTLLWFTEESERKRRIVLLARKYKWTSKRRSCLVFGEKAVALITDTHHLPHLHIGAADGYDQALISCGGSAPEVLTSKWSRQRRCQLCMMLMGLCRLTGSTHLTWHHSQVQVESVMVMSVRQPNEIELSAGHASNGRSFFASATENNGVWPRIDWLENNATQLAECEWLPLAPFRCRCVQAGVIVALALAHSQDQPGYMYTFSVLRRR